MTIAVITLSAIFFSIIVIISGSAVIAGSGHPNLVWIAIAVGTLVGLAAAARLRARFNSMGIRAQNLFRSRSFGWPEIAAIRVIRAVWYCTDPGWSSAMLEVETSSGERFPLRVCTHLKRSQAEALSAFLQARATEHSFEAPGSLIKLWKVEATEQPLQSEGGS